MRRLIVIACTAAGLAVLFFQPVRARIASELVYLERLAFERVDCPAQTPRTMVAFVFGQSNAANSGAYRHRAGPTVLNFARGHCFRARDPLLGAGGVNGSVWGLFGDLVAERHDNVVLVPAGVAATAIAEFNSELAPMLAARKRDLRTVGYTVTHYLWHQGESDIGTLAQDYERELRALIARVREGDGSAPSWVAVASICQNAGSEAIAAAQRAVTNPGEKIFQGPNTDALEAGDRHDGCHLSRMGQEKVARMWAAAIR